ncbi:hypothetical protein MMC26_000670 [Xylographa opegraphella]|nr:hypothetical protein [Xylographa opegraphella]
MEIASRVCSCPLYPRLRLFPFRATAAAISRYPFWLTQDEKQHDSDGKAAIPRERLSEREKTLIKAEKDEGVAGVVDSLEVERKVEPRGISATDNTNVATNATSASATTTVGRPKAVPRKPVTRSSTKVAAKPTDKTTTKTPTKAATGTTSSRSVNDPNGIKRKKKDEENPPPIKRPRGRPKKTFETRVVINEAPTQRLDVFVFGEGSSGELGLGSTGSVIDVKRPRLNPKLSAVDVGVVQLAMGGMHAVALTHDNKILTWGVND